jgi:hypothetical protein
MVLSFRWQDFLPFFGSFHYMAICFLERKKTIYPSGMTIGYPFTGQKIRFFHNGGDRVHDLVYGEVKIRWRETDQSGGKGTGNSCYSVF